MKSLRRYLSSLSGVSVSLALHGVLAAAACFTLAQVRGGGSGGQNGSGEGFSEAPGFSAGIHEETGKIDGTPAPDVREAPAPSDDDAEPVELNPARPVVPFDAFAQGEERPVPEPVDFSDPTAGRFSATVRGSRLPSGAPSNAEANGGSGGRAGAIGAGKGEGSGTGTGAGDGTGDGQDAVQVYSPRPTYPREARRQSIEGTVVVELAVHVDGSCSVNRIVESSGSQVLDDAVVATVSTWKYKPACEGGHPTTSIEKIRFVFQLSK